MDEQYSRQSERRWGWVEIVFARVSLSVTLSTKTELSFFFFGTAKLEYYGLFDTYGLFCGCETPA